MSCVLARLPFSGSMLSTRVLAETITRASRDNPWALVSWTHAGWTAARPIVSVVAEPRFVLPIRGLE